MRDDTGVIFASAFPGYGEFASDIEKYMTDRGRREQLLALEAVRARMTGAEPAAAEVDRRIAELRHLLEVERFAYDRRFIFRCLAMGHSQFAELIGARGPNTQINAACASTTQAVSLAEDWIRTGRCRRVVVVSADDVTSDTLLPWVGSGFLASGAAATEDVVSEVATPFDRRRHGMVVGMGAAALVVESAEAAARARHPADLRGPGHRHRQQRLPRHPPGRRPRRPGHGGPGPHAPRLAASTGTPSPRRRSSSRTRPTPLPGAAPPRRRSTPCAGSSAPRADSIVITNTKGFTGHAMGAGIEDVVASRRWRPASSRPCPTTRSPIPSSGTLNLSLGGAYPVNYALRLAAGFGSQVAMSLLRWTPMPDGRRRAPSELGYAYRIVDPGRLAALAGCGHRASGCPARGRPPPAADRRRRCSVRRPGRPRLAARALRRRDPGRGRPPLRRLRTGGSGSAAPAPAAAGAPRRCAPRPPAAPAPPAEPAAPVATR